MADTTHVGWKTEPVRDDQGNGPKTAVASRDGLAARGPRARDGLFAFTISTTAAQALTNRPRQEAARAPRTARLTATRRKRCQRPPLDVMNGPQGLTSAERRSIVFGDQRRAPTPTSNWVPSLSSRRQKKS